MTAIRVNEDIVIIDMGLDSIESQFTRMQNEKMHSKTYQMVRYK